MILSVRPVRPSVRPSVCQCVCLSVCLFVCLSVRQSICSSFRLSVYLSVQYLSLCDCLFANAFCQSCHERINLTKVCNGHMANSVGANKYIYITRHYGLT